MKVGVDPAILCAGDIHHRSAQQSPHRHGNARLFECFALSCLFECFARVHQTGGQLPAVAPAPLVQHHQHLAVTNHKNASASERPPHDRILPMNTRGTHRTLLVVSEVDHITEMSRSSSARITPLKEPVNGRAMSDRPAAGMVPPLTPAAPPY